MGGEAKDYVLVSEASRLLLLVEKDSGTAGCDAFRNRVIEATSYEATAAEGAGAATTDRGQAVRR
jgi:hypothetical protein